MDRNEVQSVAEQAEANARFAPPGSQQIALLLIGMLARALLR